jgi:hypothetical protein
MFFQRFIFPAKTLWEKYSERIWVFHTSVLTIQSSISQFEFPFEQLSTIKLFQCFHIQMVVVPFLRNNPSAVMFFQRFIFLPCLHMALSYQTVSKTLI